jgi:hypothetical protein
MVVASVHFADVGVARAMTAKVPNAAGLRSANLGFAAPLSARVLPAPSLSRLGLFATWDDERSLRRFLAVDPLAATMASGWRAILEPIRAHGTWPGLPDDVDRRRATEFDGQSVVLTLGRLRIRRTVPFLRASAAAEGAVLTAPGHLWSTGFARPPFVATCSLWDSTAAIFQYAYGSTSAAHPEAIARDRAHPFHKMSAFVRFRPLEVAGELDGPNPLTAHTMAAR